MDFRQRDSYIQHFRANLMPVEIERTTRGEWKHRHNAGAYAWDYARRRKVARIFGRALARVDRTNIEALATFAVHVENTSERLGEAREMWQYDMKNMFAEFNPTTYTAMRREGYKFSQCEWEAVPWVGQSWWQLSPFKYLHGAHMSTTTPGNIAFAENQTKRELERYTSMKAGRYLTRFFKDKLSERELKLWAEKCAALSLPVAMHFVGPDDSDGWVEIYRDGPSSCMSGESAECVSVYAHAKSVLRLAYLTHGDDIVGRCIVREDRKEYIRVYPNTDSTTGQKYHTKLTELLEEAGYVRGNLHGVLLKATSTGEYDQYVMPYLDYGTSSRGNMCVDLVGDGKYFVVGHSGVSADSTEGYIDLTPRATCDDCEDTVDEDDMNHIEYNDRSVCDHCLNNNYVYAFGRRGFEMWASTDDTVECQSDGHYYIEEYAHYNNVYQCEVTGDWYKMEDLVSTREGWVCTDEAIKLDEDDPEGNSYAARERDTVQTHDGRTIHRDSAEERDGKTYHVDDEQEETVTEGEEE